MIVHIRGKRHHGKAHQMHVSTYQKPNVLEWLFMFKRAGVFNYVGKGTKWYPLTFAVTTTGKKLLVMGNKPIRNKSLIKVLQNVHP